MPAPLLVKVSVEPGANKLPPTLVAPEPVLAKLFVVPLNVDPFKRMPAYVALTFPLNVGLLENVSDVPSAVTTPPLNVPLVLVIDPPVIVKPNVEILLAA